MPEDLAAIELPPARVWARGGARPVLALHCSLAHAVAWAGLAEALDGVTISRGMDGRPIGMVCPTCTV